MVFQKLYSTLPQLKEHKNFDAQNGIWKSLPSVLKQCILIAFKLIIQSQVRSIPNRKQNNRLQKVQKPGRFLTEDIFLLPWINHIPVD